MRSSVADYKVVKPLSGPGPNARYVCRPPERLQYQAGEVMVTQLSVDPVAWESVSDFLTRCAAVTSDHLLQLVEAGPDTEAAGEGGYLATEMPAGWLWAASADVDPPARVRAVAGAAKGAHALHESGLAHGAISDKTIALTGRGGVLTPPPLDLPAGGLVRMGDWRDILTVDRNVLSGEESSRSSDIWALGATLHLALSARPLYPGIEEDAPVTAVQRVLFTRPEVDPDLPSGLAAVIRACLETDPASRPATAEELAERMQAAEAAT